MFSSTIFMIAIPLTTVFCVVPDEDSHSGLLSVPCNFTTTPRSCLNCSTRLICKSMGGLVKPCRKLDRPHCVDGRCNAIPSPKCATHTTVKVNKVMVTREDIGNVESTSEGSTTTSSNFESNTTEGDSSEGSTSEGPTTDNTSDESSTDGTSKGTTDENSTTETIADDTTANDDSDPTDGTESDE